MAIKPWCYFTTSNKFKVKIDKSDLKKVHEHTWRVTEGTTGRQRVVTSFRTKKGRLHFAGTATVASEKT